MKPSCLLLIGAMGVFLLTACSLGVTPSPATPSPLILTPVLVSPIPSPSPLPTQTRLPTATSTLPVAPRIPVWGMGLGQIAPGDSSSGFEQMVQAGIDWVRTDNVVSWAGVESVEGKRNWTVLASLAQGWQTASSLGIKPIVVVRVTPSWAQEVPGYSCGPIKPDKLGAFASFMNELVARYSVPPYNVKYWEIWNEPDIDYRVPSVTPNNDWGCWGNQDDAYYGGGVYADMLKVVYPQIKAADPHAQVLIGGLLLDCDPRGSPSVCATVHPADPYADRPPKFLEGILRNNGGPYFDGISFHAYDYYLSGNLGVYANSNWRSVWNTTGPVLIAKTQFIQSLLMQYGVSGKFLMNTEVALICGSCSDSTFETTKAYYVAQAYTAAISQGLRANLWYSVLGWRNSGLLNADLSPRPAYTAFQFASSELRDAAFVREITEYAGVKGYEFQRGDRRIWILWSFDGSTHSISLSGVPLAGWRVHDTSVTPVTPAASMDVTLNPLYLEWNP